MSLRKRLVLLLAIFAVYAVAAAAVTIFGSQWRVEAAVRRFEQLTLSTSQLEQTNILLTQQLSQLRELLNGRAEAMREYSKARDAFFSGLQGITAYAPKFVNGDEWSRILRLAHVFEERCNHVLDLINEGQTQEARKVLEMQIDLDTELVRSLRSGITEARTILDEARNRSARELATTSTQILTLTTMVAILALGLVILGTMFIRRWLIQPIADLQEATTRYSEGDLSARTTPRTQDELGSLALALNEMARSVAASEQKYRALFSNLRDAVVICDRDGIIIEYHDSDTHLLAVEEATHAGKHILEVWPEWRSALEDWSSVVRAAADDGRRVQVVDAQLNTLPHDRQSRFADLLVYRVDYGDTSYAAIILRDATERHRLQTRLRRAETLEAVGTMAGGLAHDVNNLLTSISSTLDTLAGQHPDAEFNPRIQAAQRACRQAAGLAKRLLNFASGAHGNPQIFAPGPMVETILASMEPAFLDDVSLEKEIDHQIVIRMDQDQFAQIILNLIKNARDAMPRGGTLRIRLSSTVVRHPEEGMASKPHALLEVQDSGAGMTPEVELRVFEPFFTTKSRAAVRGRGMGLTVVYSAVQGAGGFLKLNSEPGRGTTFQVFLPIHGNDVSSLQRQESMSVRN